MRIILCLLALSLSLPATTYYVSNTGSDAANGTSTSTPWQTVAKVNSMTFQPGDSVLFQDGGVWAETLIPPSSGTSGLPILFSSYGSGAKPKITGGSNTYAVHILSVSYLQISGLEISNATDTGYGIVIEGAANVLINNVLLDNSKDDGFLIAQGSSLITLTNSTVSGNGTGTSGDRNGIGIGGAGAGSHDITISSNSISGNYADNVRVSMTSSNSTPYNVTVTNNNISGSKTGSGFAVDGCTNLVVAYNAITGNTAGTGIYVTPSNISGTIENVGVSIYNNTIYGNVYGALFTTGGGGTASIVNRNNVYSQNSTYEIYLAGSPTLTSGYNDIYHSAGGNFMFAGGAGTFAQWQSIGGYDTSGSINADPLLISPPSNLAIQPTSPARNAGMAISGYPFPYGAPDLGAIPFYAKAANTLAF